MANIAECGVAIAKEDLAKLDDAITRTKQGEGIEEVFAYDIVSENDRHSVKHYHHYVYGGNGTSVNKSYYEVDGERVEIDDYDKKYPHDKWMCDYQTHKCLVDKAYSNGWCVDWKKLHAYSYEMDTYVQEYDDHITIFFGGRWCFPEKLEEFLNSKEVLWQGAEAECGCAYLNDELGNSDFGLVASITKDDEGYDDYYVEDRS